MLCLLLCGFLLVYCPADAKAADTVEAENISGQSVIAEQKGFKNLGSLFNKKNNGGNRSESNAWMVLEHEAGIGSLYFQFTERNERMTITDMDSGETRQTHAAAFLHEFVDLVEMFGKATTNN